jgi:hypothetical protein
LSGPCRATASSELVATSVDVGSDLKNEEEIQ